MIDTLSEHTILQIWEQGLPQHMAERTLTILAAILPDTSHDALLAMSIGVRDAHLLTVREHTFGSRFASYAECQRCQERLEFTFTTADIRADTVAASASEHVHQIVVHDYDVQMRLPNTNDLLAIMQTHTVTEARQRLLQRCILHVVRADEIVDPRALPEHIVQEIGEYIVQRDPQSEVQLALTCPACNYQWSVVFDIVTFLWREIQAQAKRLLREVHTLAQAYGWHEAEILSMSSVRRRLYLEMVAQ